jgi:hypothetical protein
MSRSVKTVRRILFLGTSFLAGCSTAHDVAVSSFRVIDAPANYIRRKIDPPATTTTTTTTVASDSVTPGQHVAPPKRENQRNQVTTTQPGPTATPRMTQQTTVVKPKPSQTPALRSAANPPTEYPTAKNVPGKPGYVFSPFDPSGGYVDVNGYPSGSKVKDPYSGKVFLVP